MTTVQDDSRSVTEQVTPDGAVLEATAEDGTYYTLEIPYNGLVAATEIRMTPIVSVSGFPLSDGFLGGVRLEPAGLQFATPARLTIEPSRSVPTENQIAFAVGSGNEAYLQPIDPEPSVIAMDVTHFSAYAAGSGTAADRSEAASSTPSDPRDQADHKLGDASHEYREGDISQEEWISAFEAHAQQTYSTVVKPAMDHAESVSTLGDTTVLDDISTALTTYLGWERQLQLLGFDELLAAEREALLAQFVRIMQNVYHAMYARCVEDHDLTVLSFLIQAERQNQLLGIPYTGSFVDCLSFEVRVRLEVYTTNDGGWLDTVLTSVVPLETDLTRYWGSASLPYTEATAYDVADDDCGSWEFIGTNASAFTVHALNFVTTLVGSDSDVFQPLRVDDATMLYDIGRPEEVWQCPGASESLALATTKVVFESMHENESAGFGDVLYAADWSLEPAGSAIIARKSYERTVTGEFCGLLLPDYVSCTDPTTATESTVFEIVHNPTP